MLNVTELVEDELAVDEGVTLVLTVRAVVPVPDRERDEVALVLPVSVELAVTEIDTEFERGAVTVKDIEFVAVMLQEFDEVCEVEEELLRESVVDGVTVLVNVKLPLSEAVAVSDTEYVELLENETLRERVRVAESVVVGVTGGVRVPVRLSVVDRLSDTDAVRVAEVVKELDELFVSDADCERE